MSAELARLTKALAGRYPIEGEIGSGGMAVVYRARDLRHDRAVALKVMRPEISMGLGPQRFLREVTLAAGLTHPHIVPVYDSGEADGLLYYVMPVIEGESLRDRLNRDTRLPLTEAVALVRGVAGALDYAHRRGVVHRDIKPENLLLHDGHALVTDFGVACALTEAANRDTLTLGGVTVGTPAYMSPEQGSGGEVDGRSDLYSLGCVFFEALTGHPPFSAADAWAVIAQRLSRTPPPVVQLRPEIPPGVGRVVSRLLALNPADRYQTGAELISTLKDPRGEVRWVADKAVAVLPFANMTGDPASEYFSDGVTEEIINTLARVRGLRVTPRTTAFTFKGTEEDVGAIARRLGVAAVLEGSVRKAGDRVRVTARLIDAKEGRHLWSERFDRELVDIFAIEDEIAGAIATRMEASLAERTSEGGDEVPAERVRAYDLYLRGRYHWNQRGAGLLKGLECFREATALDPTLAVAHAGVADATSLLAFYSYLSPQEAGPVARRAADRAIALDPTIAEAHSAAGWVSMTFDWDWRAAAASFTRAIALNPAYLPARLWYAAFLGFVHHKIDDAITLTQQAVELDPASVFARIHLAVMLINARRFDAAVDVLEQGLALDRTSFLAHRYLSMVYRLVGRLDDARRAAETEIRIAGDHPWALADVAMTRAALGEPEAADRAIAAMLEQRAQRYVQPVILALALARRGRCDEALRWFRTGVLERDPAAFIYGWPDLDPIRDDPAFRAALDEAGLHVPGDRPAAEEPTR